MLFVFLDSRPAVKRIFQHLAAADQRGLHTEEESVRPAQHEAVPGVRGQHDQLHMQGQRR